MTANVLAAGACAALFFVTAMLTERVRACLPRLSAAMIPTVVSGAVAACAALALFFYLVAARDFGGILLSVASGLAGMAFGQYRFKSMNHVGALGALLMSVGFFIASGALATHSLPMVYGAAGFGALGFAGVLFGWFSASSSRSGGRAPL